MTFKELDESEALELLEGQKDLLPELLGKDEEVYAKANCPFCKGELQKMLNTAKTLNQQGVLPQYLCRCITCGGVIDPWTDIVVKLGDLGNLEPAVPLIHKD